MVNVIAWPPVSWTAFEWTLQQPIGRSRSIFDSRRIVSQAQRDRLVGVILVNGRGNDKAGAGYVEMLKRQLQGGVHLVRMNVRSPLWTGVSRGLDRRTSVLEWVEGSTEMEWVAGAADILWSTGLPLSGVPEMDGTWNAIRVEGFPPNVIVARPSERITVTDGVTTEASTIMTVARSDSDGEALIRITDELTMTGLVSIGDPESLVFEVEEMPRAVQPLSGNWAFTFNFRQVFEEETDGFVELDPWR